MINESDRRAAQNVIYLAACALNGKTPERASVEEMDLDAVYATASRHKLSACVAVALERVGFADARSTAFISTALRRAVLFEDAYAGVKSGLEAADVWYAPLKGIILKDYYPQFGMREMADYDFLIDAEREEDVRRIMEGLGFTTQSYGCSNHDVYYKPPVMNFQMHTKLFTPSHSEKLYAYYQNAPALLRGSGCEKHFSPEDFYLHVIAHAYRHYREGGTGLRSLLDVFVFLEKQPLDLDYVAAESEKLGIGEFENDLRALSQKLFRDEKITQNEERMLDYMISSGAYGTLEHRVEYGVGEKGRFGYLVSRIAPPRSTLAVRYPILHENPILYPYFCVRRLLHTLLHTGRRAVFREIKAVFKR